MNINWNNSREGYHCTRRYSCEFAKWEHLQELINVPARTRNLEAGVSRVKQASCEFRSRRSKFVLPKGKAPYLRGGGIGF